MADEARTPSHIAERDLLIDAIDEKRYFATAWTHELRRDSEQSGLPRPVVSQKRDKLAGSNLERKASQRNERAEAAFDSLEANA